MPTVKFVFSPVKLSNPRATLKDVLLFLFFPFDIIIEKD
jgi:hypothetical protein